MRGLDYCRLSKVERQEVLDQMRDLELCEFTGSIVLPVGHWEQIAMTLAKRLAEWAAPVQPGGMPADHQHLTAATCGKGEGKCSNKTMVNTSELWRKPQ